MVDGGFDVWEIPLDDSGLLLAMHLLFLASTQPLDFTPVASLGARLRRLMRHAIEADGRFPSFQRCPWCPTSAKELTAHQP